jgi:hypothetical protein
MSFAATELPGDIAMNEIEDYRFESAGEDVYLLVDGQRIAVTKLLVPSTSRARWTVIEDGWRVDGTLGQPIIHPPLPPAA